ncbi:MAG: glycosyltransferase [Patescibacteria group bacterium]
MLSIIIPTLNEEKVLERTLVSLRKLKSVNFEIIVSDGNSTDKTVSIAKKYADIVVEDLGGKRQTIAKGRNAGAIRAKGDYLVFLDADVSIPDVDNFFIETLDEFKQSHNLVGLAVFLKVFPEHATLSDKLFFTLLNNIYYISNNFFHIGIASGEFQMIRTEVFKELGGFDETLVAAEDGDMFKRLSKVGETKVLAGLHVLHTSRRAHQIGWTKLIWLWIMNALYARFLKRSFSGEWTVLR